MKDYYSRLDLPVTATKREIEAELPAMGDATMRRNARFVLLDPERRLVYDQCHRALRQIAFLRANLGLNRAPFWKLSDCDDFNSEPFARRRRKRRRPMVKPLLALLLLVLALWALVELLTPGPPSLEGPDPVEQSNTEEPETTAPVDLHEDLPLARPPRAWKDWHESFRPEVAPLRKAWRNLTNGLDQRTFELAESHCRGLQRAVQNADRNRLLPSPDFELDEAIHRFLEHLAGAARSCRSQRYFEMTEELDRAQEGWDQIERRLRYQALEP